jgi:hypothetical protein
VKNKRGWVLWKEVYWVGFWSGGLHMVSFSEGMDGQREVLGLVGSARKGWEWL